MKKTFFLLPLLILFSVGLCAQVTSTMTVSAQVISGVKTEKISNLYLSNHSSSAHNGEIIISSSPLSDVFIFVEENSVLTDSSGDTFQIETDSLISSDTHTGISAVSISGTLPSNKNLTGQYSGTITTTIVYL